MNKYLVFRCGKCIWKNTKSHELIGVEMAEDIDDVFEDIHVYSIDEVFIDAIQANMIIRCLELSNPKEPLRKITPAGTG